MQTRAKPGVRVRPIGAVEVASSAVARLAPRAWTPHIDRFRHDVRALVDGLTGVREPACIEPSTPRVVPAALGAIDPIEHVLPKGSARRRWVTLRTDVSWLVRDLRGERRSPLVPRPASRSAETRPRGVAEAARPLRVVSIVRETPDAISIVLSELDGSPLAFEAGQFLTFQLDVGGQRLRRAYSLSTSPLDGPTAAVTVKRSGRGSGWLHGELREGDVLRALGPSGSFVAPKETGPAHLVMIAGGSGITPVISIAETVLRARPELSVTLFYGNRGTEDIIFAGRIERLRSAHPERFHVEHVLSEPDEGWTGVRGILDRNTIDHLLGSIEEDRARVHYVCGPAPMMDAAREALVARGVPAEAIREERFLSPSDASALEAELPDAPVVVRMKVRGRDHVVRVDPGQTLLEAGLAAGADLPFSCAMGGCGACKAKLVSGTVHLEEPNCLHPDERDAGYVLTCSSRPTAPAVLEIDE